MADRSDFIRDIIDEDLRTGRHTQVATRFPPEPNGYLHIGHAKSICLNFGLAREYRGTCNLRYDDTNPAKEDVEYVESIERDVRWLGFEPSAVLFSADYFPRMYALAERLVEAGLAYVCDLDDEAIRAYRGTLAEPGRPSPFRDRSVAENLDLLRRMKAGEFPDGARTLRAKIDMASSNMKMRDPLLYRIRHAHHHRTGDAWCIYPMYDYAHPLEDAIEGITHSICTLEFENNRELYDWVLDHTGPWNPRPRQYEFARLALDYTVMSKRKLLALVTGKYVSGWDDPRMPTISGMRRRGYSAEAIRSFAEMVGVAKANSTVDFGKLEYCVRDELNKNAPRALGVLHPVEVELAGAPAIYIERDDWRDEPPADYQRLAPGRTVRLRHSHCISDAEVVTRDATGTVTKLRARVVPDTLGKNPTDGRKVAGVIHWVDATTSVTAEVRLYDQLFRSAKPEEGGADFLADLNPHSLEVVRGARLEASLATAPAGARVQLERVGYFIVDPDSRPGAPVWNRIITLRDSYEAAKPVAPVADKPREKNDKAKTRPKSKSPAEYRAEARARDAELASWHATIGALPGVSAEWADLLAGDRATAQLFLAAKASSVELAAKWIINELPRALDGAELAEAKLATPAFVELIARLAAGTVSPAVGKKALADLVTSGKGLSDVLGASAAPIDATELGARADQLIQAHADKAAQVKAGKTGLLGFFVGQLIKAAPDADPKIVNDVLRDRLGLS